MSEVFEALFVIALSYLSVLIALPVAQTALGTFGVENVILFHVTLFWAVCVMHIIHAFMKTIWGE